MMKGYNESINCYANSVIGEVNVVFMSANISSSGNYNISQNIQEVEIYDANREECDADYAEFKKKVDEIVSKL